MSAAADKYVAVIGPATAKNVLHAGLPDDILVHVAPVLVGDGTRLLDHPGGTNVRLEPMGGAPAMTNVWLRAKHEPYPKSS
jgi:riboflavin biosynthesis pyrimidine reductase